MSTDNDEMMSSTASADAAPTPSAASEGPTPSVPGGGQAPAPREYRPRPYTPRPYGGSRDGDGGGSRGGPRRPRPGGRSERYPVRRKMNSYCLEHRDYIDYKDVNGLRRFLSERGKIEPRRKTGANAHCQRMITTALKRARHMALLPFVGPFNR